MNVPRDRLDNKKGSQDGEYPPISVKVRSNVELSEADVFRKVVNEVVARNKLAVDKDLLERFIDAKIASGDMLSKGGAPISDLGEPEAFNKKRPHDKGYIVSAGSDFQKAIASFAKSPTETLDRIEREKKMAETPAEPGPKTGAPNAAGNTPANGVGSETAPGSKSSGTPSNQPAADYGVPPGKSLSDVASGRDSQPIDVTLSKLAASAYDNNKYGPPPEGWRAINETDVAKRLGVAPDDPKVSQWFRDNLGGSYALAGDPTKEHEFKAQIYTDDKGNFVLSYRGTAEGWPDWYDNNLRQGVGFTTDGTSDKFSGTAVSTAQEFLRMFGQYDASGKPTNLALVGHSQGGGLATIGSLSTGIPAVTFDASGLHSNTIARIGMTPEQAKAFAENGGIRAYSLEKDALTNLQESNGIIGALAPDALGTKIRLRAATGKEGRLMEEYGEPEIGGSTIKRKIIDNAKLPIFVGTLPLLGPRDAYTAANLPDSLISHSPKALTDALIDHKPWLPKPIPTPRPTPTPTPTPEPTTTPTVVDSAPPKGTPVPQPHPTPPPRKQPDQNDQQQSVVRSKENFETSAALATCNAGQATAKSTNGQPSLDDPTHPRNGMFRQALGPIQNRDVELGRGQDDTTFRLAAGVTADARARGLDTIAFAQFSEDGRRFYMADTRDPSLPWARTAVGDVGQALQQSVGDSTQLVAQIDQAQAIARQQSQTTEQQDLKQGGPTIQGPRLV